MPLLSIVVPTHNRAQYAKGCIAAVLGIKDAELQMVVADTSTDRELHDWLHDEGSRFGLDSRLTYRKIDYRSNVTRNHNDAMALATGEFVCVIGDDDCITSAALDAARWASANGAQAVSQTQTSIYAWPDFRSQTVGGGHAGRLYVPRGLGKVRWRRAADDLAAALSRACQATDGLPRTYHGIVRRDLFLKLKQRTGAFYHGSSPDMSAAIGIACMIDRYCEVDLPLSISGISSGSNSGRSALNTHKGDLASDPQTRDFQETGWPAGVPRFFSVETVWAHAGLEMLRLLRPELTPSFNYARLLGLCRLRHPEFALAIDEATREAEQIIGTHPKIAQEIRHERLRRLRYLAGRVIIPTAAHGRRYVARLPDVTAASRRYEEYAADSKLVFSRLITALSSGVRL